MKNKLQQNLNNLINNKSILTGLGVVFLSIVIVYMTNGFFPIWLVAIAVIFLYVVYMFYLILNRLQDHRHRLLIYRNEIIAQTQALMHIHQNVNVKGYIPPMIPWSASPDFVSIIIQQILFREPRFILELGSGGSTVVLATLIKERDLNVRLISIDHDEYYANQTREHLKFNNLNDYVDVQGRPLKKYEIAADKYNWYTWDEEGPEEIDMLIVDGPPGAINKQSRYPALPVLEKDLREGASILVDDADRPDEITMISRWIREFDCYKAMEWETDKGTVEIIYAPTEGTSD